jgi:hypothetical protein
MSLCARTAGREKMKGGIQTIWSAFFKAKSLDHGEVGFELP